MAEFPALPIFTDALIADTQHLSDEELGAYLKLLMLTWRTANCKLPADAAWHMRRLGADESKYNRLFKPLLAEFFITDGNSVYQKRLLKEFHYLRDLSVKQSARAKARWDKEKRSCRDSAASGNAPHPTPPTKDSGAKAPSSPHTPYPDWLPVDTFGAFKEMRKGQRSRLTPKAEQLAITQLDKLRAEGHDPTLVIEQSILRGWKSFYKLKGDHDEDTRHRPASPESKWVTEGRRLAEKYRSQALADGQSDAR